MSDGAPDLAATDLSPPDPAITELVRAPRTLPPAPVVIGLTAYNGARFIAETLVSLKQQTRRDFVLVVLDDASSDETLEIALRKMGGDPRLVVYRHKTRQGMIATWREVFVLARRAAPRARWFAWASDHDVLDKDWLLRLLDHAQSHPEAGAVYPSIRHMSKKGEINPVAPASYENRDPDPIRRFDHVQVKGAGFGNIIYGLFRVDLLEAAGVFRRVLAPDRLTVLEVALMGQLHLVEDALRLRRKTGKFSIERQKRSLFGEGGPPPHAQLPFFLPHAALILRHHLASGGLAWKTRLSLVVGRMLLDQSWRQVFTPLRKRRERAALERAAAAAAKVEP